MNRIVISLIIMVQISISYGFLHHSSNSIASVKRASRYSTNMLTSRRQSAAINCGRLMDNRDVKSYYFRGLISSCHSLPYNMKQFHSLSTSRPSSLQMGKNSNNDHLKLDDQSKKYIQTLVKDMMLSSLDEFAAESLQNGSNLDLSDMQSQTDTNPSNDEDLLNSVIRIYCTHSEPNFNMPWQRRKQESSTSSGFIIHTSNRHHHPDQSPRSYILTNAHSVEYGSIIQVKKRQSEKKYLARALAGMLDPTICAF